MRRVRLLAQHVAGFPCAGGDESDSDDELDFDDLDELDLDDEDFSFDDDELDDMLAAFDDVPEGGGEEAGGLGGEEGGGGMMDEMASEPELLEQLLDPDPAVHAPAALQLRALWLEDAGPFAVDELEDAMRPLAEGGGGRRSALEACAAALRVVTEEYPSWAEGLNQLARVELLLSSTEEAVRLSLLALEQQPAHFECLVRLCVAYALAGNEAEGKAAAARLEEVCPALQDPATKLVDAMVTRQGSLEQVRVEMELVGLIMFGPIMQGMAELGRTLRPEEEGGEEDEAEGDDEDLFAEHERKHVSFEEPEDGEELEVDGEEVEEEEAQGPPPQRLRLLYNPRRDLPESIAPFGHAAGSEVGLVELRGGLFTAYDGLFGKVKAFDVTLQRYVVSIEDGTEVAVRPQHVRSFGPRALVVLWAHLRRGFSGQAGRGSHG
eukprot:COSAG04_NODE_695_length_11066_cov_14.905352_5_plen_436_part_00